MELHQRIERLEATGLILAILVLSLIASSVMILAQGAPADRGTTYRIELLEREQKTNAKVCERCGGRGDIDRIESRVEGQKYVTVTSTDTCPSCRGGRVGYAFLGERGKVYPSDLTFSAKAVVPEGTVYVSTPAPR